MAGARARRHRARLASALATIALLACLAMPSVSVAAPAQAAVPLSICQSDPGKCIAVTPGYGATGTQVTARGSNLHSGDTITIGYSTDGCKTVVTISGASGKVGTDGTVTIVFPWPSTPAGHYDVCATDTATGVTLQAPGGFQVYAPAITATSPVQSGATVTVNGTGFKPTGSDNGQQAEVLYGGADGCATSVATVTVAADGTFSTTFPAPNEAAETTIIVAAVEPQQTCSGTPNLKATAHVDVQPPLHPTISVIGTVTSGESMHVTGTDFRAADGPVQILYGAQGSDGCAHALGTATVKADGTFSTTVTAPTVSAQTTVTLAGVQPVGSCASNWKQKARVAVTIQTQGGGIIGFLRSGTAVFCLAGLLLLLLLLLLLFLLLRQRNKQQPVTIEERDRVVVNANRPGGGTAQVERQIVARDARGNVTPIAEEVYTSQEDLVDDPGSSGGAGGGLRGPNGGNAGPYGGLGNRQ